MAMVHLPESPTRQQEESNDTEETPNVSEPSEAVAATSEKPEEEDEEAKLRELPNPKDEEVGGVGVGGTTSDQNEISSAEASVSTSTTGTRSGTSSSISSNSSSRPSSRGSEKNESISLPQHQYDKEELIKLSKTDLAKKWPDFLDPTFLNTSGVWDPEKWFKNKRGTDTPTDDARAKRERPAEFERDLSFKRRTPDPKERIKEERDDIVLSPQRRSFGTGCHVSQQTFPVTTSNNRRPGSPNDSREPESLHRDTRRIGSGRIVSRDTRDKDREYGYGGGRNNRFDRDDREKEPPTRFMGRYRANDRRMSRGRDDRIDEEDEPEWFSAGPTSQHETIELVGFDNPCNHEKSVAGRGRRGKELTRKNLMPTRLSEANVRSQNREPEPLVPTKDVIERGGDKSGEKVVVVTERVSSSPSPRPNEMDQQQQNDSDKKQDFDLNDIFKMDWIPGLLPNGSPPEAADSGFTGSRFSQWFSRDSPVKDLLDSEENSRRSSIQDEIRAQMMGLKRGPSPPSQHHSSSNNYFIPINPPGMHHGGGQRYNHEHHGGGAGSKDGKNILEILQNANINVTPLLNSENHTHSLKDETMSGKAKSVVELEADLKQLVLGGNRASEEKSAFNKLLSQLSDQGATMSAPPQSISMGHVDKSKIIQEEDLITQNFNLRMMQQQQQHHQHQHQHHNQLIQHVAAQHRQPTPPTHVQQHQPNNVVPAKQPPQQPIIQMPDLRISPTPTLAPPQMYGVDKDMLIDFFKDLDKPPVSVSSTTSSVNVNVTLGQGQGHQNVMRPKEQQEQQQQQQQQPNNVADMMRVLYEQGNQNEMMVRLMAQQQHLHNMQNAAQQQQQQQQQNSRIFQTASPGTVERTMQQAMNQAFQNKQQQQQQAKPHDLMATQQQRPKFMSTLVPAPYGGHILNPSPTPDPSMGQTLGVPIAVGPHLSPRQSPLSHDLGTAVPARIPSPLVFGQAPPLLSHAPAPIHPSQISQSNTLQVQNQNALPRVPSPQELAAHTQTILQNALIKRKLEEQKENYRKRQEAQRSRSPNVVATTPGGTALPKSPSSNTAPITSSSSPSKFTSTMAAFTPTSVMRKMHSEKLDKENRGDAVSPQQQQGKGHDVSSPEHKIQTTPTSANNSQSSIPQQNGVIQHQQQHLQNNHGGGMNHHNHVIENHQQQHQIEHHSPQRLITGANGNGGTGSGSGGPNAPRALYGQGIFGQQQQQASQSQAAIAVAAAQQLQRNQSGGPVYTVQGRPIVKGTVPEQDQSRGGPMNSSAPQQQQPPKVNVGGPQHKQFMLPNQGNVIRPGDMDPYVAAHFVQQKMILGQQALQRQLNATATPKPAPNIPFYPRGTPMVTPHQNVLRPPVVSNSNENMNFFGRGGIFVPPPALRGQSPNYSQILAYQQQQQKCAQNMKASHQQPQQTDQRTSMDPRTLGNLHPLALQQVFFNVQSQVAQGQGIMQLNNNIGMSGRPDGNFCGGPNMKNQQLMPPGQQGGNRHSPVNLARWFGNDVLKQKMPDMPPVPLQNALSVEELERQQHTTVVHN